MRRDTLSVGSHLTMKYARAMVGTAAVVAMGLAYAIGRAHADGIPTSHPMYYAGTLDNAGVPVEGMQDITIRVWTAATGGTLACAETDAPGTTVAGGQFRVAIDDSCTAAVEMTPDLWVETLVGGTSFGRSKIGAVPFAVEAQRAATPSGTLATRLAAVEAASRPRQFVTGSTGACSGVATAATMTFVATATGTYRISFSGLGSGMVSINSVGTSAGVSGGSVNLGAGGVFTLEAFAGLTSGTSYTFVVSCGSPSASVYTPGPFVAYQL